MPGRVFLLVMALASGCTSPELDRTAADAVALGFGRIECGNVAVPTVYADTVGTSDIDAYCAAVQAAIERITERRFVSPETLSQDSLAAAYVWVQRFARSNLETSLPDSGFAVTLDLVQRDRNILVAGPWEGGIMEVSWSPEGLRY